MTFSVIYDINFLVAVELYRDSKLLTWPIQHHRLLGHTQLLGNILEMARFSRNQGTNNSNVFPVPSRTAVESRRGSQVGSLEWIRYIFTWTTRRVSGEM
jgi:hypothetical protein